MLVKSKELRAQRAKICQDAAALINKDKPSKEDVAAYDAMQAEADALKAQIDRIERSEQQIAEQNEQLHQRAQRAGKDPEQVHGEDDLEESTFKAYLRRGFAGLNAEQRAVFEKRFLAAQSTDTTEGGYTVPAGFLKQLEGAMKTFGGMLQVATIIDTATGNSLPMPTYNDSNNKGRRIDENTEITNVTDVVFSQIAFNAYKYSSDIIKVSSELLQDSAFDMNSFLAGIAGERIGRALNYDLTQEDGSSKPNGIVHAATAGATTAAANAIGFTDLLDLLHSVDPAYRTNGRWMMNDQSLKACKGIVDDNHRPLWIAGLSVREPDTILGYPYTINQDMDNPTTVTAGHKPIVFGALSKYYIRRVAGTTLLRLTERYAEFGQVAFLALQRWDGDLVDAGTHPVKYMAMHA